MATILLSQLPAMAGESDLVINSLQNCLYQAQLRVDDELHTLCRNDGKPITSHSLGQMYEQLGGYAFRGVYLRQTSPYDEMIGQPPAAGSNRLEVAVGWRELGAVSGR
ncbi:hypothetical protein FV139_14560 [Parahaliea maris]|uniref:Uncharacterized protein n=1 Tax=Parahaliea maris TaxID=2716870 RepID=A0A5C8ZTY3_9GAMM|nr:DUF6482 family protein [Parahaliea maris]TXS91945.1 hypothetical protein FV139_14560 [Parahaliea maris]